MKKLLLVSIISIASFSAIASTTWSVKSTTDDFTDEVSVSAQTTQLENAKHGLLMYCYGPGEVRIGLSGGSYNSDTTYYVTKLRVDKNEAFEISMQGGERNRLHWLIDMKEYLEQFKAGSYAVLLTKGYDYEKKAIKFKLGGFSAAYKTVQAGCK